MIPTSKEKYATRLGELEALARELGSPGRPGDGGPLVGRLLEAAGDLLRRSAAVSAPRTAIDQALALVPEAGLASWSSGVDEPALASRLKQAASHAVESAIPDADDDAQLLAGYAMEALRSRDRLESARVALEALATTGRGDARVQGERLDALLTRVDGAARKRCASLTPLNAERRREAQLLDEPARGRAWWFAERSGPEHDGLVATLGGVPKGSLGAPEQHAARVVDAPRTRAPGFDELFRYDLGLATPAEAAVIRRGADRDEGMQEILRALDAGEQAIAELTRGEDPTTPSRAPVSSPVEPLGGEPEQVVEKSEFKLLVFRTKQRLQVVVQPRHRQHRIAAALEAPGVLARPLDAQPGPQGLHFELGEPQRFRGQRAIARVTLESGAAVLVELAL